MTRIAILGSGAGFATAERFSSSMVVLTGGAAYLLDCGDPCAALLYRAGIDPLLVRMIAVSHMHADHVGGLPSLLSCIHLPQRHSGADAAELLPWSVNASADWYQRQLRFPAKPASAGEPVTLLLPEDSVQAVTRFLPAVYLGPDDLSYQLDIKGVAPGIVYRDGCVEVRAVANCHLESNPEYLRKRTITADRRQQAFSYSITTNDGTIVYSGDIYALRELIPLLGDEQVLIMEMAHYDPMELTAFLPKVHARVIVLTHVHPGLESAIDRIVRELADPRVIVAYDGMEITLP